MRHANHAKYTMNFECQMLENSNSLNNNSDLHEMHVKNESVYKKIAYLRSERRF